MAARSPRMTVRCLSPALVAALSAAVSLSLACGRCPALSWVLPLKPPGRIGGNPGEPVRRSVPDRREPGTTAQPLSWAEVSVPQGVGPEDAFREAGFERIFGCPLTVEGHSRTLSRPFPEQTDPGFLLAQWKDGRMVTEADIDILLFDVLGTVVDETGTVRAELAAALDQAGAGRGQSEALAAAWARRFASLVAKIREGAAWRSADELHAEALADVLRDGPLLPEATVQRLALVGHRLSPWPDAVEALQRLAQRFTVVALSNGNLSMLVDLFSSAGLTWHCVVSGEMVHAYKPDPAMYRFALERLALDPRRTLMVAAHPWDLRAAAAHGLRTAYIEREGEGDPEPSDTFDLALPDLASLATRLLMAM